MSRRTVKLRAGLPAGWEGRLVPAPLGWRAEGWYSDALDTEMVVCGWRLRKRDAADVLRQWIHSTHLMPRDVWWSNHLPMEPVADGIYLPDDLNTGRGRHL